MLHICPIIQGKNKEHLETLTQHIIQTKFKKK